MVIIYHSNNRVSKIVTAQNASVPFQHYRYISEIFFSLAKQFPESKIVWCHLLLQDSLNIGAIATLFHHNKMMISYGNSNISFLRNEIGFVEESPFINVNKEVRYPTWLMNSDIGVIHASVLNSIVGEINLDVDFDYFLNSIAKICMPLGLLCYSESRLLFKNNANTSSHKTSLFILFRFVKQHYKTRWVFLLFINLIIYEKRFALMPLLYSLYFKTRKKTKINLDNILVESTMNVIDKKTIDVIIPTIGRKKYLYDVLKDLSKQTHLPVNVIIIEQNLLFESVSELDYLHTEKWPYSIKHTFTHQAGACNARNLALSQVESEWVFLADDDILFKPTVIQESLEKLKFYGVKAASLRCLQNGQNKKKENVFQWGAFGSGCSFVSSDALKECEFKMGYEFGFGEDSDFGMQLRNEGTDIIYLPNPEILHLKAPIGGFRTKPVLEWQDDLIQPKPSPTVMLFKILHLTNQQINAYKTILLFKYYNQQKIRNPYSYFVYFQKQWKQSVFWANRLKSRS